MLTSQDAKNRFSAVVEAGQAPRESLAEHQLAFPGGEIARAEARPRDVRL